MKIATAVCRERGASALIALIFLVIVAFVVLTAYRLSGQQLALAGNAQSRAHMLAAANFAIKSPFPDEARLPEIAIDGLPEEVAVVADQVNRMRDRLDELLFGFQDYAVVAHRPPSGSPDQQ